MIWLEALLLLSDPQAGECFYITAPALIAVFHCCRCCVSYGKGGHLLCAFPLEASSSGFNAPVSPQ